MLVFGWAGFQPRTSMLARALGGKVLFTRAGRRRRSRWLLPLVYAFDAARTWTSLTAHRPQTVVVITPPVFAPLVALTWCLAHSARLVVDCHTGAFIDPRWAWSRPLHRLLLKRSLVALAHNDADRTRLEGWGIRALLLPDDLPAASDAGPAPARGDRPTVLVAGSFDETEPAAAAMAAAALVPELELRFTGDPLRLPPRLRSSAGVNVVLTGYLDYPRFLGEMLRADAVAVFSEETDTMSRAAFEAVGLGRPLILSDQPGLRARFADAAIFTPNRPEAMAAALREAIARAEELCVRSREVSAQLESQRSTALEKLVSLLAQAAPPECDRVLVVSGYAFPDHVVLRNVRSLLEAGAAVDVLCPWTSNLVDFRKEGRSRLRVYRLPIFHRRSRALWYALEYCMLLLLALALVSVLGMRRRYAAVDVYNSTDLAVFTAVVPKLRGARVVLNMLEMNPELAAARLRLGPAHPLIRLLRVCERLAVAWSDRVITVSAPCCDILTRRGVAQDRVLVVPNTQPSDSYSGSRGERVEPLLVAHGVQIERYGLQVAIRALAVLVPRWPNLALELIGDGEYQPELRRLAGELGIGGHVRFVGSLYWGEALQRVSKASIGLVTVLDDGYGHLVLPTRLLEYAALRIPAVCSRLPAIERYFPEDAVAYVEPGNAVELASRIDALLSNPPLGRKQADRAAAALRSISWDAVSSRYLAALGLGGGVAVSHAA